MYYIHICAMQWEKFPRLQERITFHCLMDLIKKISFVFEYAVDPRPPPGAEGFCCGFYLA